MNPECCAAMKLALSRVGKTTRIGLMRETLWNPGTGHRDVLVLRLPRAKRGDRSQFSKTTYIELGFCPFCGKPVDP